MCVNVLHTVEHYSEAAGIEPAISNCKRPNHWMPLHTHLRQTLYYVFYRPFARPAGQPMAPQHQRQRQACKKTGKTSRLKLYLVRVQIQHFKHLLNRLTEELKRLRSFRPFLESLDNRLANFLHTITQQTGFKASVPFSIWISDTVF